MPRRTNTQVSARVRRGKGRGLCRVQVNSEQVALDSLAEAGERLCRPDVSRELIPPLWCQNREELGLGRAMFACFCEGGASRLAEVFERSARAGAWGLTNVWR